MANMARRRVRVRDENILELLTESDVEGFSPSDEDNGDPPYTQETNDNGTEEDSSDSDISDDPEVPVNRNTKSVTRGNRGGRGLRGGRGAERGRGRGHQQLVPSNSPSASGSTHWSIKDFPPVEYTLLEPSYLPNSYKDSSKLEFYEQYIDQKFGELVVERTNQTSVALHGRSLNMSVKEFHIYVGITFVMAALNYPWLRMYWEAKWRVPIIADKMSRNRFTLLRNSLKVVFDGDVNEETRKKDKLWKMRPLISQIQQGCRIQEKDQRLSLDEMIIPSTGSSGMKQCCPGKPNPVGLKAFVLANPNGLVDDFEVNQGNTTYPQLETSNFGLGAKVVLSLGDSLVPGHLLYFDRYFTTVKLAKELTERGIGCTATIQKNRVPGDARSVLMDDKELQKRGRGSVHKIAIIKWFDNKPVTLLSNVDALEPMDVCQRWCKSRKQYLSVDRQAAVRNYNKYMGGVDLADRMLSVCPNRYRTKKWTKRFFSHMLDMAVSNSWLAYKQQEIYKGVHPKKVQQLRHFKMELGEALIDINSSSVGADNDSADSDPEPEPVTRKRGKPSSTPIPSKKIPAPMPVPAHQPAVRQTRAPAAAATAAAPTQAAPRRRRTRRRPKKSRGPAEAARALLRPVLTSRLPLPTKTYIYKTYLRSRLTYAAPAWYVFTSAANRKRQAQQNLALRALTGGAHYLIRNTTIATDLGAESVEEFVCRLARKLYDRADHGPYEHLRDLAPNYC